MKIPEVVFAKIEACPAPRLVGVSGYGGSGKTTFAQELGVHLSADVIGVDDFITNRLEGEMCAWDGYDFKRLVSEVVHPFLNGATSITYGVYDWTSNTISHERTVNTSGVLIIEGVGLFQPGLAGGFAVKIWIDCPFETALERGMARDRAQGADHDALWRGVWRQNELDFEDRYNPQRMADILIQN